MKLSKERINRLSRILTERLIGQKFIESPLSSKEIVKRIEEAVTEDLIGEDRLNMEVREILKTYEAEIEEGNLDYQKMFLLVKKQLIRERGLIL